MRLCEQIPTPKTPANTPQLPAAAEVVQSLRRFAQEVGWQAGGREEGGRAGGRAGGAGQQFGCGKRGRAGGRPRCQPLRRMRSS